MRSNLKKIFFFLPLSIRRFFLLSYEKYFAITCQKRESLEYDIPSPSKNEPSLKTQKNILIYHIAGLGFGGTEKTLQLIANNICDEYIVYFLSSEEPAHTRRNYLDKRINLIHFKYTKKDSFYPFYISGMNPHIKDVLSLQHIDLIITADSGYTQYPLNTISTTPIIMVNIFGSPTLQKNIVSSVFISKAVKNHSEKYIGSKKTDCVAYLPTLNPAQGAEVRAKEIREIFSIPTDAFVFGRIGRNADSIFDPIGIFSFQKVVRKFPNVHYIIMSPPPLLRKIVDEQKIPNVHFLEPSANEVDIWGFHYAINCLAHFRRDGETYGMNITESMRAGNPIITHKSSIWNAHLEYLESTFSRIASIDDLESYATYMEEFITIYTSDKIAWGKMRGAALKTTEKLFSEIEYTKEIKKIITASL